MRADVHRREQAEQTRERVLGAAARLFEQRGYEGASIAAIAEQARVSQVTIYARFQNKRTLLGELVHRAVRGDDPAPVLEQAGPSRGRCRRRPARAAAAVRSRRRPTARARRPARHDRRRRLALRARAR